MSETTSTTTSTSRSPRVPRIGTDGDPYAVTRALIGVLTAHQDDAGDPAATTPDGTPLLDVLTSTQTGDTFARRFDTDPVEALYCYLDEYETFDHRDAVAAIVDQLGAAGTWAALAGYTGRYGSSSWALHRLLHDGLLPGGNRIFIDGADHPDLQAKAVDRELGSSSAAFDPDLLCSYWERSGRSLATLLSTVLPQRLGYNLPTPLVRRLVTLVRQTLADATEATVRGLVTNRGSYQLTDAQRTMLLDAAATCAAEGDRDGELANTIVAAQLGCLVHTEADKLAESLTGLALIANREHGLEGTFGSAYGQQVTAHANDLDVRLLNRRGATAVLQRMPAEVPADPARFLTLLDRSGVARSWLLMGLPIPVTPDLARAAFDAGLVTLDDLVVAAPRLLLALQAGSSSRALGTAEDWYAMLAQVPGLPAHLYTRFAEDGQRGSYRTAQAAQESSVLLTMVAAELGDDAKLWDRFLTADPGSPFRNPQASFASAADVYRTRWAEQAARTTAKERSTRPFRR